MNTLDKINTRRLINQIQEEIGGILTNHVYNFARFEEINDSIKQYLTNIAKTKTIRGEFSVESRKIIGHKLVANNHKLVKVYWILDNNTNHYIRKKFYGRRTAKVYIKHNIKTTMLTDISITPTSAMNYITINCKVEKEF